MLCLWCTTAFAEESSFTPLASANTIFLDSSQVDHIFLQNFPSPSEYQKNRSAVSTFTPQNDTQEVLEQTYKPDKDNNGEIKPVEQEKKDYSFSDMDFFAPPSEYKPVLNVIKHEELMPPKELPQNEENSSNYYASAEETSDTSDYEGKIISEIKVSGLNTLGDDAVLSQVSAKCGSKFNTEILQQDLQRIYYAGYFTDKMHVEPTLNDDDTVSLEFIVHENPLVKDIEIKGNTVLSQNELLKFISPLKGLPQNLFMVNEAIEKINHCYEEKGYILAKVTSVDDNADGVLTLGITEGIIDKIEFEGEHKTKDYIIERNIMTQPGTVYNEEMLKKDLARIYATQIFEEVNRKIEPSANKDGEYVVKIVIKEASSNSVSIGAGIDNALGVFGSLSIRENNFLGKAQQVSLSGMIGSGLLLNDSSIKNRMNYQIELNFKEPHFINADNSLISKLYLRELGSFQIPLAVERRFGISGVISHKVGGSDNFTTNLGLGFENIHLQEGDYNKIKKQYDIRHIDFAKRKNQLTGGNFFNIAPGVKYSNLDSEFMPREGLIAKANFVEAVSLNRIKNTNGRLVGSITRYIPILNKSSLSITAKGGIKVHGNNMPEIMAFRLGGPYSIRGFRMSGVGSGDSFLMGSAELQTPVPFMDRFKYDVLKNLRLAFFIDAGKIFDPTITSSLYDRPNGAISLGVGLRVNIPGMGPISVDYGLPLTHVGEYNSKHGYFTFGTSGLYDDNYGY